MLYGRREAHERNSNLGHQVSARGVKRNGVRAEVNLGSHFMALNDEQGGEK